jgi:hypothetical protein
MKQLSITTRNYVNIYCGPAITSQSTGNTRVEGGVTRLTVPVNSQPEDVRLTSVPTHFTLRKACAQQRE